MSVAAKRPVDIQGSDPSKRPKGNDFEDGLQKMSQTTASQARGGFGFLGDQVWARPPLAPMRDNELDISFQQIDAEEADYKDGQVVRMFGVTENGNTVMCDVTGFLHYFYVPAPVGFRTEDAADLATSLGPDCDHIEIAMKQSLWGYHGDEKVPFLKIVARVPQAIPRLRRRFEDGDYGLSSKFQYSRTTFDRTSYVERLTVDCHILGMAWITLPAGKYEVVKQKKVSRTQLEVRINFKDLVAHAAEGDWLKSAPLRILSFDIECAGRKGVFPEAEIDPVIQIANMVQIQGATTPFVRNVFTVGTTAPIVGSEVFNHDREDEMLMAWRTFINEVDPDVIIGYNIGNFDLPYLIGRATALRLTDFPYFGRLIHMQQTVSTNNFSSKAFGTLESKVTTIHGRFQIDMLQYIRREYKLRSYSLNAVSAHFLGEQKEDVHHSIITELQNGNADSRYRLAVYCLKDAYLPLRLLDKLMTLVNMTEMARVTGVPISYLLLRGQQVKVMSQLLRKALQVGMVIPNMKSEGSLDEQYEGATVIDPIRGFYNIPIATLDFSSLYPSIMMAHNLCYTTLLDDASIKRLDLKQDEDYVVTPNGDKFVKQSKRHGLLPVILDELLTARKRAKADLKVETDPFRKAVLDGRQLALKISANSVYGFTGATVGRLPCLAISSSVTAYGRGMIEQTKNKVEEHYTKSNGYDFDAQVVYGDTDSVMVKFGPQDLAECMRLGEEAAGLVSQIFIRPIKLEFEKVYFPYLLINKKRYAGLYWTRPEKYDKMDAKGIETVRRDNCQMVQNVIETVLDKILIERDVSKAENFVKEAISDLLQNRVDLSQLVITKQLTRKDYAGKQPHVELAERMRKRDPGSAPALGDRVAYVIVKAASGAKNYDKSEDPMWVLEHNIPIDTTYYLENQLKNPLLRIFEPILGEAKASKLLTGVHTSKITVATPTTGALMKFAVKTELCKSCKRPLRNRKGPVCELCVDKLPKLFCESLTSVNELQLKFARLWTQCQRCQGSLHQDVLCSSKDCPIFFMRRTAQKELETGQAELAKFNEIDW